MLNCNELLILTSLSIVTAGSPVNIVKKPVTSKASTVVEAIKHYSRTPSRATRLLALPASIKHKTVKPLTLSGRLPDPRK